MDNACFLIGGRNTPPSVEPELRALIEECIVGHGVKQFVVGHYGAFDRIAQRTLADAKKAHPEIILTLLLPYHPAERPVSLPAGFDDSIYPSGLETTPKRIAIVRANRWMIDHSRHLIAFPAPIGNSRTLLEYARTRPALQIHPTPKTSQKQQ